jgi:hypothetical protein
MTSQVGPTISISKRRLNTRTPHVRRALSFGRDASRGIWCDGTWLRRSANRLASV